jgi:integrase
MGLAAALPPYVPRIDPARYDRAAEFAPEEWQALAAWQTWQGQGQIRRTLARLHRPLLDVLVDATGGVPPERVCTIRFVLREMQRTRTPFWAWDDRQWLGLLGMPQTGHPFVRSHLLAIAYQLTGFARLHELERMHSISTTARLVFGDEPYKTALVRLAGALGGIGYKNTTITNNLPMVLSFLMMEARDPRLEAIDAALLGRLRDRYPSQIGGFAVMISSGLAALGILEVPLPLLRASTCPEKQSEGVDPQWAGWCRRWLQTSTLRPRTRSATHTWLLRVGLWLRKAHPEVTAPDHWSAEVCADFLAAVDRRRVGEWALATSGTNWSRRIGEPVKASSKKVTIQSVRRFLADCQLWDWVRLRCNPRLHLATPRGIEALTGPNPRAIDDHIWLKLIWASLNLTPADCPARIRYPYEMLRAVAVVWTHAGLRPNEIIRLRVGCARSQDDDVIDEAGKVTPAGTLCYLDVPVGKTGNAYVKPVAAVVLQHVGAWEVVRPAQDPVLDERTGERVSFLFQFRGRAVSQHIIHAAVIPMLCAKAGVAVQDSMGKITSHRGRASAVTALAQGA